MDLKKFISLKQPGHLGQVPGYVPSVSTEKIDFEFDSIIYNQDSFSQKNSNDLTELSTLTKNFAQDSVTWININDSSTASVQVLAESIALHPLVQEDIVHLHQRPKLEDWDDHLYVVIKMLYFNQQDVLQQEQVSFVLGKNYLISFQEKLGDVFDAVRARIINNKGRVRRKGADYLLYCLLDAICDQYFVVLDKLGFKAEFIESKVETDPSMENLTAIQELKQELIHVRRFILPVRELAISLIKAESGLLSEEVLPFWKDMLDHNNQVVESTEILRDFVNGVIEISHALLSNRMNEIMKVLTMVSTIFIPITFIAGIYGMNFQNMPELAMPWAYPATIAVMVLISIAMLIYFKTKRWW